MMKILMNLKGNDTFILLEQLEFLSYLNSKYENKSPLFVRHLVMYQSDW